MLDTQHHIELPQKPVQSDRLTWFRFGQLEGNILMTTDTGAWHLLTPAVFSQFLDGSLSEDDEAYAELCRKGFLRQDYDIERHAEQFRRTKRLIDVGPTHHYIHLSTGSARLELEQAKLILDHIFSSPPQTLTIVLVQGPENPDPNVISFIHDFAEQKNQYEQKELRFELHCKALELDETSMALLVEKRIQVRTSFDGDSALHERQRTVTGAASYDTTLAQIEALHAKARAAGLTSDDYSVFTDVHVGHTATNSAERILEGLRKAQVHDFCVTPLLKGPNAIQIDAFGTLYGEILHAVSSQTNPESPLREVNAEALLARLTTGDVAENLMMVSKPSSGLNGRSYNPQGDIFPACSALELHAEGDAIFWLGNVVNTSLEDISQHETIRSLVVASIADCLPGFQHLWSTPYIGIDPVAAYQTTGDIFTQMPTSLLHRANHAMVEATFRALIQQ